MKKAVFLLILLTYSAFIVYAQPIKIQGTKPSARVIATGVPVPTATPTHDMPEGKPSTTAKSVQKIKIDGEMNEKVLTSPVIVNGDDSDISGKVYIGYGSGGVYIFADVKDDVPGRNTQTGDKIWNGDSLEICVAIDPREKPDRTKLGKKDFRIGIKASENPEGWNYRLKSPLDKAKIVYKQKGGGYVIEALVPWHNLQRGCFCKLKNRLTGFNCVLNDSDNEEGKEFQARWYGDYSYSVNPSQWGSITFSTAR